MARPKPQPVSELRRAEDLYWDAAQVRYTIEDMFADGHATRGHLRQAKKIEAEAFLWVLALRSAAASPIHDYQVAA